MGVHHFLELCELLAARRAQRHRSFDPGEPWPHIMADGEKNPQIEGAVELD